MGMEEQILHETVEMDMKGREYTLDQINSLSTNVTGI